MFLYNFLRLYIPHNVKHPSQSSVYTLIYIHILLYQFYPDKDKCLDFFAIAIEQRIKDIPHIINTSSIIFKIPQTKFGFHSNGRTVNKPCLLLFLLRQRKQGKVK